MPIIILSPPPRPSPSKSGLRATSAQIWKLEDMRTLQWMSYPALLMLSSRVLERKIIDIGQMTRSEIKRVIKELECNQL